MEKKTIQYSKILPVLTGGIFVFVIIASVMLYSETVYYMVYVTAIGASAGCFGSAVIWYMKKSQIENVYQKKIDMCHHVTTEEIRRTREILKLQNEYKITKEEIKEIDFDSNVDDMRQEAVRDVEETLNNAMDDASSDTSIQSY